MGKGAHGSGEPGLVNLTHGGEGNEAVTITAQVFGAKHHREGWEQPHWAEAILQHTVRFSSSQPALTQWARGQPKPHGHGSETTAGQPWDGAGKLGASLQDSQRGEGSAAQPESQVSPCHWGAEALTQQNPSLQTPEPPRCPPGIGANIWTHVPCCEARAGLLHTTHFLYFCLKCSVLFPKSLQMTPSIWHTRLRVPGTLHLHRDALETRGLGRFLQGLNQNQR